MTRRDCRQRKNRHRIVDHESIDQFTQLWITLLMPLHHWHRLFTLCCRCTAFHAIEKNRFEAAKLAALFYGICGEIAEQKANGPGSFRTQFLDAASFYSQPR